MTWPNDVKFSMNKDKNTTKNIEELAFFHLTHLKAYF